MAKYLIENEDGRRATASNLREARLCACDLIAFNPYSLYGIHVKGKTPSTMARIMKVEKGTSPIRTRTTLVEKIYYNAYGEIIVRKFPPEESGGLRRNRCYSLGPTGNLGEYHGLSTE